MKPKVEKLEEEVGAMRESVKNLNEAEHLNQQHSTELARRVERLERYSRDFNIRVLGAGEEEGEHCIKTIKHYLSLLGFEDDAWEIENAHRIGKRRDDKPRHIIVKLYSRPFKRTLPEGFTK